MITNKIEARDDVNIKGNLNVTGKVAMEGTVELGHDLEVDGTVTVNSASDLKTKDGTAFGEANVLIGYNGDPTATNELVATLSFNDGKTLNIWADNAGNGIASYQSYYREDTGVLIGTFTDYHQKSYNIYAPKPTEVHLYRHLANFMTGNGYPFFIADVITTDSTPFDSDTFISFLGKNGYNSSNACLPVTGYLSGSEEVYGICATEGGHFRFVVRNSGTITTSSLYAYTGTFTDTVVQIV